MKELAQTIARLLYEKKARNIVALDVSGMTVITDCMLIASGRNELQVRALADEVEEQLAQQGVLPLRKEGLREARWVVMDYDTVLVHLFREEERGFYRLDQLWDAGGNRLPLPFGGAAED